MLIVTGQPTVTPKPAEGALDHPAMRQDLKACGSSQPTDDFQAPAQLLPDGLDQTGVGAVHPDQLQPTPTVMHTALDSVEQRLQDELAAGGVLNAGTVYDHHPQQTQRIHHNMSLAPVG